jgi:hypothetical protein
VLGRGLHLPVDPLGVVGVAQRVGHLRALAAFGAARRLPDDLADWSNDDFKDYITGRCESGQASSATNHVLVIKTIHRFGPALTCGGLDRDPWPGTSTNAVVNHPIVPELTTPVIKPDTWFPLVRAAWTYIEVFAPDILAALARLRQIEADAREVDASEADRLFRAWAEGPDTTVPLWLSRAGRASVDWSLLSAQIGVSPNGTDLFSGRDRLGRQRRALVQALAARGSCRASLLPALAQVVRPDGATGPWHEALHPRELWTEAIMLRNACYVFVAALSMMRDCEIRDIVKESVVEHYGSPAVPATKRKLDPDLPVKHWWIIDPVARAIDVASQLSLNDQLAFAAVSPRRTGEGFVSQGAIRDFIAHVNSRRQHTGLPETPPQKLTPHMFRRTMAMLTRDFPGSEIAVGMQLKHVADRALANRSTQGYMDHDPSWARHLDRAIAQRRFERLRELFDADTRGESIGYGPGADRMRESFAAVREKAGDLRARGQAQRGDVRVEHDLLRRTRISIRFGTLNHCMMDDDNPVGAKCLEDAVVPEGHRGPLLDRCQPGRCANSVIGPQHVPIWKAERDSLTHLIATPRLPNNRRAALAAQLHDVELVIKRAEP